MADKDDMPAIPAWMRSPKVSPRLTFGCVLLMTVLVLPGAAQELKVVTQISQLNALAGIEPPSYFPVHLEAVVLFADTKTGLLALQDPTGVVSVNTDLGDLTPHSGDKILLEGNCAVEGPDIVIGRVPIVDNDGVHSTKEKSVQVFLRAGRHALRLDWFDAGGEAILEVSYEGPGLPRQKIPSSGLFRPVVDGQSTNWVAGLDYKDCEGEWLAIPNFVHTPLTKRGSVENFDIEIRSRTNNVALEFTGFLDIPRDGDYIFSTLSDDGSQLYIDEEPAHLRILGKVALPEPRKLVLGESSTNGPQWGQVEGKIVFAGRKTDGWELDLRAGGGRLDVELPDAAECSPEIWLQSQVRVTGLALSGFNSSGARLITKIFVPGPELVQLLNAGPDQWSSPIVPIVQIGAMGRSSRPQFFAHVRARVLAERPPSSLVLADESGEVLAEMSEPPQLHPGDWIEVIGRRESTGTNQPLKDCIFRKTDTNGPKVAAALPVLTWIEQVHRLKRDEAERAYPVLIRGVVTAAWGANGMIQDATRGIFVPNLTPGSATSAHVGDYLEVEGHAGPGDFAPIINADRVTFLGRARMPEPIRPSWDQLLNGSMDCQFVEIEGVVTSVQSNGLTLLLHGGRIFTELEDWNEIALKRFENARVRVRGSFSAIWDGQTHQVTSGRIFLHPTGISIDEPAPADLFATPAKSVAELKQFDAQAGALQRVKLTGQIIHQRQGEFFLMSQTNGVRFLPKQDYPCHLGDLVEIVGFPEIDGPSPLLRDALVRKHGSAPLPPARRISLSSPAAPAPALDATRVELEARVLGVRLERGEIVMELQDGVRTYLARVAKPPEETPLPPAGSRVRLIGVYRGQGPVSDPDGTGSFELSVNSMADLVVLESPSWWTARHALGMAAVLGGVLLLAVGWIRSLRRQVGQRTSELQLEIEHHKRTEAEVKEKAKLLAGEIEERKRVEQEVERVHKQLLLTSRQAGMAEVATSILHNVGNVLNSVNVSAGVITENLRQFKAANLVKVADLLGQHASSPEFLVSNPKGKQIPEFLRSLAERLTKEQRNNVSELAALQSNIDHIKRIVAMQQDYARLGGVLEKVKLSELVEDSIRINGGALARHGVELVREFQADPELLIEKHKVLQILVNLIQNAKQACVESGRPDARILVNIPPVSADRIKIRISDNGTGITAENLKRIFTPGFTTRKNGHGFGLHGCILAAKELKGDLSVESQGFGKGATFVLELPFPPNGV